MNQHTPKYEANKTFKYCGVTYRHGDEWHPGGYLNDKTLISLGFVREIKSEQTKIINNFYCQECERGFKSKAGLMAHNRSKHG